MKSGPCLQSIAPTIIPLFLAPAFAESGAVTHSAVRSFSSTTCNHARKARDLNRRRGESVMRSTGPRNELSVQRAYRELPKPRAEADRPLKEFPTNPNHGLYGFFNQDKETVVPGEREEQHGRSWALHELTFKSFSDLHTIYWQGLLEVNRIKTRRLEHERLHLGFGSYEADERLSTVFDTLRNIRKVLRTRQEAWEEANLIREQTKTVDGLKKFLEDREAKAERRVQVTRGGFGLSSVPEDNLQPIQTTSIPEDLPEPARRTSVPEDLPSSKRPRGQPTSASGSN